MVIGPFLLVLGAILIAAYLHLGGIGASVRLIELPIIALVVPLVLGMLASRMVSEPLHRLEDAIVDLSKSRSRVTLPPSELKEFDTIVASFNQLSEQLAKEEDLRKGLISDTAHELNTPIAALISQLEGMREGIIKKDKAHMELLLEQADRLNSVTQSLLDYARVQSSSVNPHITTVKWEVIIKRLKHTLGADLQERHIELITDLDTPDIQADELLLERLLTNLVTNAIRYSKGSEIRIEYHDRALRVFDNGVGVPEATLQHLFERFYRVEQSRNRETGGLGLGLAIVKEIADAHGWLITAQNMHPGLGFLIVC